MLTFNIQESCLQLTVIGILWFQLAFKYPQELTLTNYLNRG